MRMNRTGWGRIIGPAARFLGISVVMAITAGPFGAPRAMAAYGGGNPGQVVGWTSFMGVVNLRKLAAANPPAALSEFGGDQQQLAVETDPFHAGIPRVSVRRTQAGTIEAAPAPATMAKATAFGISLPAFGFTGLTHADQRLADGGNQSDWEPANPALAVNGNYVLEAVSKAITVYSASGRRLLSPVALNLFFDQAPAVDRATGRRGTYLGAPRAYYDSASQRWFVTVVGSLLSTSGAPLYISVEFIAVSQTDNPTGNWFLYELETTNQAIKGCPCLPDFQQVGFDAHGVFLSGNLFTRSSYYPLGANIYALSKAGLESGRGSSVYQFPLLPNDLTVHPTSMPPDARSPGAEHGTEYLVESQVDLANDGTSSKIRVFAISGTASLATAKPALVLNAVDVATQTYALPINVGQPDGPRPLAKWLAKGGKPVPPAPPLYGEGGWVESQPAYVNGHIVLAFTTGLPVSAKPTKDGVAWFELGVSGAAATLAARLDAQGVVNPAGPASLLYPAVAMPLNGLGAIGATLVGPGNYPSAAVIPLDLHGRGGFSGPIQVTGLGALPEDGFTGYTFFSGNPDPVAEWGGYSAAAVDAKGSLWFGSEYIPDTAAYPRTKYANWGTFITRVRRPASPNVSTGSR